MNPDDKFCRVCGAQIVAAAGTSVTSPQGFSAVPAKTSGKAIVSLVSGLCFFFFPLSIVAIIFGHLSLSEIRRSAGRLTGNGIAIAGLVLGYAGVVAVPMILIIAAIAIPNLLRARMAANEASAVASIRTINIAEIRYSQSHNGSGYTCALSDLEAEQLVNSTLASGQKNGYVFELTACGPGANSAAISNYRITASPINRNQTGVRAFCSDESGAIKADPGGSPENCLGQGVALQ